MSRVLLNASLILLAAGLIMTASVNRYQYFSVVGPAWSGKRDADTDYRRIDRWTGTLQAWVCQDVATAQVANVPSPPSKPSDFDSVENTDSVVRTGQYFIELSQWRTAYPRVDPENLHVTRPVCGWEAAR